MTLAEKECVPCKGGVPPLKGEPLKKLHDQLDSWDLIEEHHITKTYTFKSFKDSMEFTNKVAALAEQQDHHPDINISFNKVALVLWTHKIDGLSESDFIFAAKADKLI
ncbi:MAG: 4a-hydroxytetrahydrobiopterin dehydratase [Candidatus Nanoarchaeia archaeon]